ncbi:MAG: DUF262 domain-containing HNH endonuclease family protein [Neomegalonema sp.]|nr:DUF262 domain-containing HNH endonuclease family protein [Neomegalonema sp.]
MEISTEARPLGEMLKAGRFQPASVQRAFQWGGREASVLLNDLVAFMRRLGFAPTDCTEDVCNDGVIGSDEIDAEGRISERVSDAAGDASRVDEAMQIAVRAPSPAPRRAQPDLYFLGGVVILPAPKAPGVFHLYDGFQRTTTLMALLSALRASFDDDAAPEIETISALLLSEQAADRRRLFVSGMGGVLARMMGPPLKKRRGRFWRNAKNAAQRLADVYYVFQERFACWTDEERAFFLDALLNKVVVGVLRVENRSVAYQIFVGSNGRGRLLELSDILKGRIVELIDRGEGAPAAERCARSWSEMHKRFGDRFDTLLKASEFIRYLPREAYEAGDLLLQSIDMAEDEKAPTDALARDLSLWVAGLQDAYADSFARIRAHHAPIDSFGWDIALRRLSFLDWNEWLPVALQIDLLAGADNARRARQLHALQRFCYILDLAWWNQKGRMEIAGEAIRQLRQGHSPFANTHEDDGRVIYGAMKASERLRERARAALERPLLDPAKRGPIVRLSETLLWGDYLPNGCTDNADVEHILPQAHIGEWAEKFTEEEHEFWCNRLGNLCILEKETNRRVAAHAWAVKRQAYLDVAERFNSAADAARVDEWTVSAIAARHERMVALVSAHLRISPAA